MLVLLLFEGLVYFSQIRCVEKGIFSTFIAIGPMLAAKPPRGAGPKQIVLHGICIFAFYTWTIDAGHGS